MPIDNPSFEDEDPVNAGFAEFWTTAMIGSDGEAADYDITTAGGPPRSPMETFRGGWLANETFVFEFSDPIDLGELEPASYDGETTEDFEEAWDNAPFFFAMGVTSAASYDGNSSLESGVEPWDFTGGSGFLRLVTNLGIALSDVTAGTAAYLQAANTSSGPPIGFDPLGETVRVYFNDRGFGTVILDNTHLDVSDVAGQINFQLSLQGFGGEVTAGIINPGGGFRLFIQSNIAGNRSEVRVQNVSHPDTWQRIGMSGTQVADGAQGTGNIGLEDEVYAEELAIIIAQSPSLNAIGTGASATPSGTIVVYSPPGGTIEVDSSEPMGPALGFLLDTPVGPTGLAPETVEDFEEGYLNEIQPNEGNLYPAPGTETWTESDPSFGETVPDQPDPYGGTDAFKLVDFTANGGRIFTGNYVVITGVALRARLFVKKDIDAPNFMAWGINTSGGAFQFILLYFDPTLGRGKIQTSTLVDEVTVREAFGGDWWQIDIAIKSGGVSTMGFEIRPSRGPVSTWPTIGPVGVANGEQTVYGPRLVEAGAVLDGFALTWDDVNNTAALYDSGAQTVEDFTDGWLNDSFQFVMGATSSASYDSGVGGSPETTEDFEETIAPFIAVPDQATDTFTKNAHGLSNGQIVQFTPENGSMPAGLDAETDYYVIAAAANTFQVSATSGGAAVNFTTNGTGQLRVTPPPTVFWIDLMATL